MNFQKIVFIVFIGFLCSCVSQKKTVYLQDSNSAPTSGKMPDFVLKIKSNDILSIQVFTVNTEAFPGIASTVDKQVIDNRSPYEKGIIVDVDGNVELPLINKVHLADLSITEARDLLVAKFEQFMDAPIVVVKKLSFKVTILGEVNKPGLFYVSNEKITLLEALGMAGDLNIYGDRQEIKVIRQTPEGYKELKVDLTTKAALNTEVAYLYPDDVIYVKPIKRRNTLTISPTVAVVTSILATLTLMMALILRKN